MRAFLALFLICPLKPRIKFAATDGRKRVPCHAAAVNVSRSFAARDVKRASHSPHIDRLSEARRQLNYSMYTLDDENIKRF